MSESWSVWLRSGVKAEWTVAATAPNERMAITLSNDPKFTDWEVMVLPAGADPNTPARLHNVERRYGDGARQNQEPAAVRQGRGTRSGRAR